MDDARQIDTAWSGRRNARDAHLAWNWIDIVPAMREAFVVLLDGAPCAIWASKPGSPLVLGGRSYYRLDYLELDPSTEEKRRASLALFGLIAARAAEHQAEGVVLTAFNVDKLVRAYEALGARRGSPPGWNYPAELISLTFHRAALTDLRELIDAFKEVPSRTTS